jgi:hypothetical protein
MRYVVVGKKVEKKMLESSHTLRPSFSTSKIMKVKFILKVFTVAGIDVRPVDVMTILPA